MPGLARRCGAARAPRARRAPDVAEPDGEPPRVALSPVRPRALPAGPGPCGKPALEPVGRTDLARRGRTRRRALRHALERPYARRHGSRVGASEPGDPLA